jgi:hypothetical protein
MTFNVAVNGTAGHGTIGHVMQSTMKVVFEIPVHVARIGPMLLSSEIMIKVSWSKSVRLLSKNLVVDLNRAVQRVVLT